YPSFPRFTADARTCRTWRITNSSDLRVIFYQMLFYSGAVNAGIQSSSPDSRTLVATRLFESLPQRAHFFGFFQKLADGSSFIFLTAFPFVPPHDEIQLQCVGHRSETPILGICWNERIF